MICKRCEFKSVRYIAPEDGWVVPLSEKFNPLSSNKAIKCWIAIKYGYRIEDLDVSISSYALIDANDELITAYEKIVEAQKIIDTMKKVMDR